MDATGTTPPPFSRRAATVALAVLTFINLLNYLDRYVISALVESLKRSELQLSDAQLGSLFTGFVIVYMLTSPLFGILGDRQPRPRFIALGVFVWSIATALGAFARSYATLFLARAAVGIGEAAYATIAPALLADFFPIEKRGRVFAIFFAAIPIGSAAGYILGGFMDQHYGWRNAFLLAGAPGILLAFLALTLVDPPRGGQDKETSLHEQRSVRETYVSLLGNGTYAATVAGYAAYTFALGAVAFWMPAFLERIRGVPHREATVQFGAIVVITGFVGTFAGGWLADALLKRWKQSYLWVSAVSSLLAAPAALIAFTSPNRLVYMTAIAVAEILLFASTGPINSAIVNVVAPDLRATAVATSILAIHLFGDVPSPPMVGYISDHSSLSRAFLIIPVAIVVSGLVWGLTAWKLERVTA
ncbi:MAG TPA: MFS transporter [Thermoanaerobaculia bacterium]|nr:MFS transporter [Thermoanaerobaculia bacterium]